MTGDDFQNACETVGGRGTAGIQVEQPVSRRDACQQGVVTRKQHLGQWCKRVIRMGMRDEACRLEPPQKVVEALQALRFTAIHDEPMAGRHVAR